MSLGSGRDGGKITKEHKENLGNSQYVPYLYYGDDFMNVDICQSHQPVHVTFIQC